MDNVISSIRTKQQNFNEMMEKTVMYANDKSYKLKSDYNFREDKNDWFHIMNGDSCELMSLIPDNSQHFSIFSPPFSNLFTYSDNIRDLGNCLNHDEFYKNYEFILKELYRIIVPGRLIAVHTKDLAVYKNSSGYSGMYDFTGKMHAMTEAAGFKYHSKVTVWTDPVLEMQRTKTQRLLYKQVTSDSSYTGIGMPEYVTIFKKWEGNEEDWVPVTNLNKDNFSLDTWQKWASPVWMDIKRTDVLNGWKGAKDQRDEKHICPLQLDLIERCIELWSNVGESVFTPFLGIGSEIYQAVKQGRKGVGIELKESYYDLAKANLKSCIESKRQLSLI
jgi:DNA modification methylase